MVRHRGHREFKILDALVEGQIKKDLSRAIGDLKKWGLDDSRALSRGKGDDFVNYQKGLMALKNEVQAGQRIAFWDMESVNTLYMAVKNLIQEDSTVLLFKELMLSLWSLEQTARDTDDINGKWFFAQRAVSYYDKLEECMRFIDVVSWYVPLCFLCCVPVCNMNLCQVG